jgi:hypothetical protein
MLTPDPKPFADGYSARDLQRCAEREANFRTTVYKNRVLTGRMTQAQADTEIRKMRAIAMHFAELAEKERLL